MDCLRIAVALLVAAAAAGSSAEEWQPIRVPALDRSAEERFAVVRPIADFASGADGWRAFRGEQQASATASWDPQTARDAGGALRIDAEFTGRSSLEYIEFGGDVPIPEPGLGIGFWYRCEGIPANFRLRVQDRSGEVHQIPVPRDDAPPTADGWRYTAAMIADQPDAWGGDGNRRLDYPCRLHSIISDRPRAGYRGEGALWIDEVAFVEPVPARDDLALHVADRRLGNLYLPGESVRLRASAPAGTIRWRVLDFEGRTLGSGEGGSPAAEWSFGPLQPGWYECIIELHQEGAPRQAVAFRCAALADASAEPGNPFVGFCTHFYRHTIWPAEGLDLFRRYGFTELRDEIPWSIVEREKGVLALPEEPTAFTYRAEELGIAPLLIFCYGNRHYDDGGFPNSAEAVAGYARYCATLVEQLGDRVRDFEVWNEWTVRCGMQGRPGSNSPEYYARMLQAAYEAVKAVDPEVNVVGIGGEHSDHHFDEIGAMLTHGAAGSMDALSVHSYRYPESPESTDLVGEIRRVAALARDRGAAVPLWVTEIGWPTHTGPRGVDERRQARYLVRSMALLQGTGVEKVHWYDFKDDGLMRDYNEHNFGVVRHQEFNWAPKPAVVAAAVFARRTLDAQCRGVQQAGDAYLVRYTAAGGEQLGLLWSASQEVEVSLEGDVRAAYDLMGTPLPSPPRRATENPVYLYGEQLTLRQP